MESFSDQNNARNDCISDDINKLLLEYRKTIPKKLEELKTLECEAKKNPSLDNLSALRFFVHKLAGNAGTYGFTEVSTLCKQYEQEILGELKNPMNLKWLSHWDNYYERVKTGFIHE